MSAENPAVPLSQADNDLHDLFSGPASASGVRVTRNRALGYSAIWRGVHLIANGVARLPFRVYRKNGPTKEPDPGHQAARVMRRPNEFMVPFTFRQTMQAHALLDGNGYAYVARGMDAQPMELLPLHPARTWPVRADGVLWYVSELGIDETLKGKRRRKHLVKIPAADMLHIKGLGFDGLSGYPVLKLLRDAIGAAVAARDYGTRYFHNDGRPGVALEVPAAMKDTAVNNLRESWERLHTGISNAHRVAILRDGVKLTTYTATARDAQLLENREFDARDVANILGVPPHKLGDPSKTAYNSLESENQSFLDDTLDAWLTLWEQESDAKLLKEWEKEQESHCCEFTRAAILRVNMKDRADYYVKAVTTGWMNRDEVRHAEGLNPIPDRKGESFVLSVNVAPAGGPADAAPAAAGPAPAAGAEDKAAAKAAGGGQVQDTALNGAQITSLLLLTDKVALKQYPADAAEKIAISAFPAMDAQLIHQFVSGLAEYDPPAPPGGDPAPTDPPADDKPTDDKPAESDALRSALRDLAADVVGRMVRRLATHAERLAKRPAELRSWLSSGMRAEHEATVAASLAPVLAAAKARGRRVADPEYAAGLLLGAFGDAVTPNIGKASDLATAVRFDSTRFEAEWTDRTLTELFP